MREGSEPIYVLDEIDLRPGMLDSFLETLEADYAPGAAERGMRRLHTWVTPPFELAAGGTQVLIVWELDDVQSFWGTRSSSADAATWWNECERLIQSRTRRYAAESSALAAFAAAGRQNA